MIVSGSVSIFGVNFFFCEENNNVSVNIDFNLFRYFIFNFRFVMKIVERRVGKIERSVAVFNFRYLLYLWGKGEICLLHRVLMFSLLWKLLFKTFIINYNFNFNDRDIEITLMVHVNTKSFPLLGSDTIRYAVVNFG